MRTENEGVIEEEAVDPWALNEEEFCALVLKLDDSDTTLHVDADNHEDTLLGNVGGKMEGSNEFRIAKLIFSAYGRQKSKKKGTFKTRVERKLASMLRVLEQIEYREQDREAEMLDSETTEHKTEEGAAERLFKAFKRPSMRNSISTTIPLREVPPKGLPKSPAEKLPKSPVGELFNVKQKRHVFDFFEGGAGDSAEL